MKSRRIPLLSKSRFLAGRQCPLRLWYQCYERHLASEISPAQQAIFDTGHAVGRLATKLYPAGVLIEEEFFRHEQAVSSTLAAMENPDVKAIYEAAFIHDGVRIRADVLQRLVNGDWNLIEVKSSTDVKDVYLFDVAIQSYVLRGCGLSIQQAGILHLDNQYIYDGSRIELDRLFTFTDLTDKLFVQLGLVSSQLDKFKAMLAGKTAPAIPPDRHCMNPYPCEFWEHCIREKPEFWVYHLSGIGQQKLLELAEMGVEDIGEIPASFALTDIQKRIKTCVISRDEYVSKQLESELNDVQFPMQFLDFETVGPAIPRYKDTRPYQTIPFQWSNHIVTADGGMDHQEYLCDQDKDPREEFARTLLETVGDQGTIFIYTNYEKGITHALADHLPQYSARLNAISDRFKDLYAIIKQHYYHPKFHGSFSLKSVLPALLPEMSYENMAIQEGSQASLEYLRMIDPVTPAAEKERIKSDLLTYCGRDTLAMVKIREKLLKRFS